MFRLESQFQVFVGRNRESKQLGWLLNQSLNSGARMVVLSGDTGIGKTTLLEQLKANVTALGGYYIPCKANLWGSTFPYHPLAEMIQVFIQAIGQSTVEPILSGYSPRVLNDLALLVPKFSALFRSAAKGSTYSEQLPSTLFLENACRIVGTLLADKPLVLVVEDLPYTDPTTFETIQYFLNNSEDFPILICATYDLDRININDSRYKPFRTFINTLGYEERLTKIRLEPFSKEETEEYVCRLLGEKGLPGGLLDVVFYKSEGNPLIIRQLIGNAIEQGRLYQENGRWTFSHPEEVQLPQEIREMILIRLEGIRPELKYILTVGAVIGRKFSTRILAAVLQRKPENLLPFLEEAIELQLIEENRESESINYSFLSGRIHEVLYSSISYQRKVMLHGQIGRLLEQEDHAALFPEELAYHFQWDHDKVKAVKYAVLAGQRSLSLYAFLTARNYFKRAYDLFQKLDSSEQAIHRYAVLEGVAESASFLGYYSEAQRLFEEILNLGGDFNEEETANVHQKLGDLYFRMGNFEETIEHYRKALQHATPKRQAIITNHLIETHTEMGNFTQAYGLAESQLIKLEATGKNSGRLNLKVVLANLYLHQGECGKATLSLEKAPSISSNVLDKLLTDLVRGQLLMETGPLVQAEQFLAAGLHLAKQIQDPLFLGVMYLALARLDSLHGNYAKAKEWLHCVKSLAVYGDSHILQERVVNQELLLRLLDGDCSGNGEGTKEDLCLAGNGKNTGVISLDKLVKRAVLSNSPAYCQKIMNVLAKVQLHCPTPRNHLNLLRVKTAYHLVAGSNQTLAKQAMAESLVICQEYGMNAQGLINCLTWPQLCGKQHSRLFFDRLGLDCLSPKEVKLDSPPDHLPKEVKVVLEYISGKYASNLNIATLCQVANLSERQLRRVFTQYIGISTKEYVNGYRIKKAQELLRNPTLAVNQVGHLVGLGDKSHFCKTFKAIVGVTPSDYRKRKLEMSGNTNCVRKL
ncbi:MAG TPA: helix-turn-helix domain-containing protein [Desulfobacteria bacterium]|nr:helix-turn-helix domain-containing protein [Desulfobacteria bacterium]